MYVQKKGKAFYLKMSVWSPEKQRSTTISKYLGSNIDKALDTLNSEVSEYDYMELRDKLLLANKVKPEDIQKELDKVVEDLEKRLAELIADGHGEIATPIYHATLDKLIHRLPH